MKRAAIYARVSSERQAAGDRVSIEAQLADCKAHCKEQGYVIVQQYVDREKYRVRGKLVQPSGERKDRPQYKKMLKAALAGEFDVLVAWKEDRLYRGMYAAMPFSEALDELGHKLSVDLVRETFDHRMLGIKAAMAKIELDNIRERMLMGRRARLQKGEVPGGDQVKYGYEKVNKRLEVNEDEAKIVNKIFKWYISGLNNMDILRKLNRMNISPRRGKVWSKATLEKILTTEAYATGRFLTKLGDETFPISCPKIISMETWRKAQVVRKNNRFLARNVKEDFLCTGIIYCACGWKCHPKAKCSNRNRGYTTICGHYVCPRRNQSPETRTPDCLFNAIGSKKTDEYVWKFVKRVCKNRSRLKQAIYARIKHLEAEQGDIEAEAQRLQKTIDEFAMERQWVITQARKGAITEQDMEMQLAALQMQEVELQKELDEKQASVAAKEQVKALNAWANQYLSEIYDGIQALDIAPEKMTTSEKQALTTILDAGQYEKKFPGDKLAQLRWAIFREKQRIVRTLIGRVVVSRGKNGRKIKPILALDMPVGEAKSLAYGDQSPDYKVETAS